MHSQVEGIAVTAHQLAEYDVVIVGSGFAGLAAGIGSLRAGARSVIVEKRGHLGGNSLISEAILAAAGTDEQARMGIDDTAELLVTELSDRKVKADALLERSRSSLAIACEDSVTASGYPIGRCGRAASRFSTPSPTSLLGTGPIRRRWRQRSRSAPSVVGARDHAQGHRPPTASAPVCADTEERR